MVWQKELGYRLDTLTDWNSRIRPTEGISHARALNGLKGFVQYPQCLVDGSSVDRHRRLNAEAGGIAHGKQTALQTFFEKLASLFDGKGFAGFLILDELDSDEESGAVDLTDDRVFVLKLLESGDEKLSHGF